MVPKLESCEELRFLFDRAAKHLPGGGEGGGRPPSLIVMVESAMGLLNLRAVFNQVGVTSEPCTLRRYSGRRGLALSLAPLL